VMQRARITKWYTHQTALGSFRRLADGFRHFTRLAVAEADPALEVTNDNERREAEALTAFDDLGDAIDVHELVGKLAVAILTISATVSLGSTCHDLCPLVCLLKLQSAFAGGIGECLDAPVKQKSAAIKYDLADAGLDGTLGDELADGRGGSLVGAGF
jgi:hypothetical protein